MAGPVTILHVDDDPGFADLTATMLERIQPGVAVQTHTDPEAAIDALSAAADTIDCLLVDYQMPQMTGIEFLEAVETRFPNQLWAKILFTGEGSEDVAADALHAGATSYVQKGGQTDIFEYLAERIQHDHQLTLTRENSVRFDTLTDVIDDPVYVLDETGQFIYVNTAFIELTGYDRATILGSDPTLIKPPDSAAAAEDQLAQLLSTTGPSSVTFEIEIETAAGETIPCADHMGVLPYSGDSFRGSIGTLRDISERKAREEAIREAKNQYQALVEQNLVGLYLARDGELLYHNPPFAELFGYDPDTTDLTGRQLSTLVAQADQQRLAEMLADTEIGDRESVREPYVGQHVDGEIVDLQLLARGIELEGAPAVIGTVIDESNPLMSTPQLRAERDRLAEFASVLAHDLRNPLSVAQGRAELLAAETDGAAHLEPITESLDRMDTIIEDLLTLAKQGETLGETEPVDLETLATACWETVATEKATLSVRDSCSVTGDSSRLKQLFENLYRNAVEHGGSGVTVTVGTLPDGFYIADDGAGIETAVQDQLFSPGYTTAEDGTGFGLSIVDQIVRAHGWTITCVESAAGGARFEITGTEESNRDTTRSSL